jgi:hypothetical protein
LPKSASRHYAWTCVVTVNASILVNSPPRETTDQDRETLIRDAIEADVVAQQSPLNHAAVDDDRIDIIRASYSGEEMAEAGRDTIYAAACVALLPGSLSDESLTDMDASNVPGLFNMSINEPYLQEFAAKIRERTRSVEI